MLQEDGACYVTVSLLRVNTLKKTCSGEGLNIGIIINSQFEEKFSNFDTPTCKAIIVVIVNEFQLLPYFVLGFILCPKEGGAYPKWGIKTHKHFFDEMGVGHMSIKGDKFGNLYFASE